MAWRGTVCGDAGAWALCCGCAAAGREHRGRRRRLGRHRMALASPHPPSTQGLEPLRRPFATTGAHDKGGRTALAPAAARSACGGTAPRRPTWRPGRAVADKRRRSANLAVGLAPSAASATSVGAADLRPNRACLRGRSVRRGRPGTDGARADRDRRTCAASSQLLRGAGRRSPGRGGSTGLDETLRRRRQGCCGRPRSGWRPGSAAGGSGRLGGVAAPFSRRRHHPGRAPQRLLPLRAAAPDGRHRHAAGERPVRVARRA